MKYWECVCAPWDKIQWLCRGHHKGTEFSEPGRNLLVVNGVGIIKFQPEIWPWDSTRRGFASRPDGLLPRSIMFLQMTSSSSNRSARTDNKPLYSYDCSTVFVCYSRGENVLVCIDDFGSYPCWTLLQMNLFQTSLSVETYKREMPDRFTVAKQNNVMFCMRLASC